MRLCCSSLAAPARSTKSRVRRKDRRPEQKKGISTFADYVIERGEVEVAQGACQECHSRLRRDGTVIKCAQGNRPVARVAFFDSARDASLTGDPEEFLAAGRLGQCRMFAAPWLQPDPNARIERSRERN